MAGSAMEKMIAGMLGITPEQMQEMLSGFQTLLSDLSGILDEIKAQGASNGEKLDQLLAQLEAMKNDNGNDGGSNRGRTRRSAGASGTSGAGGNDG